MAKKIKVNQKAMETDSKFFKADNFPLYHLKQLFKKTKPQHSLSIIKMDMGQSPPNKKLERKNSRV